MSFVYVFFLPPSHGAPLTQYAWLFMNPPSISTVSHETEILFLTAVNSIFAQESSSIYGTKLWLPGLQPPAPILLLRTICQSLSHWCGMLVGNCVLETKLSKPSVHSQPCRYPDPIIMQLLPRWNPFFGVFSNVSMLSNTFNKYTAILWLKSALQNPVSPLLHSPTTRCVCVCVFVRDIQKS